MGWGTGFTPPTDSVPLITGEILKKICPSLHQERANIIAEYLNNICPQYGINSANILHEFIANLCEESMEFTHYDESLNYSVDSLLKSFSRERISEADAYRFGRTNEHHANPKEIANRVYGGEWGRINLGNTQPDDGFNFRGAGPMQITGRGNTTEFGNYMTKAFTISLSPEEWAQKLRTSDEYAVHSACWFFAIAKQLIDEAEADNMKEIIHKINGGYNGIEQRMKYYELCKKYIV